MFQREKTHKQKAELQIDPPFLFFAGFSCKSSLIVAKWFMSL